MAPLLSWPEIIRQRLPSMGPASFNSSSTFCRFFSDLWYICSCQGTSLGADETGDCVVICLLPVQAARDCGTATEARQAPSRCVRSHCSSTNNAQILCE